MSIFVYSVVAVRDGRWWSVKIPAIEGVTQAKRLSDVKRMATELIAVTQKVGPESVEIELHVGTVGTTEVESALLEVVRLRALADSYERKASEAIRELAKSLIVEGIPLRDIGEILGVSHQRVHQIVKA